jgi:tetratricopeptide (TPR) repeat protein
MNKKQGIYSLIIIVLLVGGLLAWQQISKERNHGSYDPYQQAEDEIKSDQPLFGDDEISDDTPEGRELLAKREKATELYSLYLTEALQYKAEGDAGNQDSYLKAIDFFERADRVSEYKFWIPLLNIGNVYKVIGDYEKANNYYDRALEITNNSEYNIYLAKIDLYLYHLEKSEVEMKSLYEEAIKNLAENAPIYTKYAAYLREIGDYDNALAYYQILSEKYPDNQGYKDRINELKNK